MNLPEQKIRWWRVISVKRQGQQYSVHTHLWHECIVNSKRLWGEKERRARGRNDLFCCAD